MSAYEDVTRKIERCAFNPPKEATMSEYEVTRKIERCAFNPPKEATMSEYEVTRKIERCTVLPPKEATMSAYEEVTRKIERCAFNPPKEATMSQSDEDVTRKIPLPVAIPVPVKYGELIVLGSNGLPPNGDQASTKKRFALWQKPKANGVKPSAVHMGVNQSISMGDQHKITFITAVTTVVLEHSRDKQTDMFQVGRSTESQIDVTVTDTEPPPEGVSLISRYACRIICQRSPPHTAHIYAAGFNSEKNIFLGERAVKWSAPDGQMDGLTTNGVLVARPLRGFTRDSAPGPWREISVRGHAFALRETKRNHPKRGNRVDGDEPRELVDGSLIDLCGVTLLWRTAEGLMARTAAAAEGGGPASRPVLKRGGRPWRPLLFNDLPFQIPRHEPVQAGEQPCGAYLQCGHVHRYHGFSEAEVEAECPSCQVRGPYVPLQPGCEEAFLLDGERGRHAFVPCGHVCSEATAAFWSRTPLHRDLASFPDTSPACPFCFQRLTGDNGYIALLQASS